jgi:acetyl/propionyl-CoA carboxylase alpha subunit
MSKIAVTIEGRTYTVEFRTPLGHEESLSVEVNGQTLVVSLNDAGGIGGAVLDGRPYEFVLDRDLHWIKTGSGLHTLDIRDLEAIVARPITGDGRVKAPIPGLISQIRVTPGQQVEAGEPILVLEAMKMQNELRAPRAGTVNGLHVSQGQTVSRGQVLVEIVESAATGG